MNKQSLQRALRNSACALVLGLAATAASAAQYLVGLDTRAYAGAGFIDLQFNPAPNGSPQASATLSGFSGALAGSAEVFGDVSGALPDTVVFGNAEDYNDLFQGITLGGLFSFMLDFNGDFLAAGAGSGSAFAVSLYGADGMTALGNPDPQSGSLLTFNLMPASLGGISVQISDAATASASSATAVPEPAEWLLMVAGVAAMAAAGRRRRAAGG